MPVAADIVRQRGQPGNKPRDGVDVADRGVAASPTTLIVQLLGDFGVSVGVRTIDDSEWYLRKAKNLVKLLALADDRRLHRGQITEMLWPELEAGAAANNLHKVLHIARRVLEPALAPKASSRYLHLNGDLVALSPVDLWIDVQAFRAAAEQAQRSRELEAYRQAIALYRGDLLPEDRYEEWTVRPRDELRALYLTLLLDAAELYSAIGEIDDATDALREVIGLDPANEQAHVALMHMYAGTGQRQAALRQYGQLRTALQAELDAEPDASAARLYSEILSGSYTPARVPSTEQVTVEPSVVFNHPVGRDEEVSRLRAYLDDLVADRGGFLILSGETGMGMAALASALQTEAVQRGALSLWGAAYGEEETNAFGPLAYALEGLAIRLNPDTLRNIAGEFLPELCQLAPAFRRALQPAQRSRAVLPVPDEDRTVSALTYFLTRLSSSVPLLVVLQDLHLADKASLNFLKHMAHFAREHRILFLCTVRSNVVTVSHRLDRICAAVQIQEPECIHLGPITRADMATLATQLLGSPVAEDVLDIVASVSGGNPYYAEETILALRGRRRIENVRGTWQVRTGISLDWDRTDVRQLVDTGGDLQLRRKLRVT